MVHDAVLKQQLWVWTFVRNYLSIEALGIVMHLDDVFAILIPPSSRNAVNVWIDAAKLRKSNVG